MTDAIEKLVDHLEVPAIGRSTREMAEMQRVIKAAHGYRVAHNVVLAPDGRVMAQANSIEDAERIVEALNARPA